MTGSPSGPTPAEVLAVVRPLADDDVDADTALFTSGLLDSLALESIQAEIERRWCTLPPGAIRVATFDTPAAIAQTVARALDEGRSGANGGRRP